MRDVQYEYTLSRYETVYSFEPMSTSIPSRVILTGKLRYSRKPARKCVSRDLCRPILPVVSVKFILYCYTCLDLVQNLALALSGFQIQVTFGRFVQRKGGVDTDLQLAILEPSKYFTRAPHQLLAVNCVIQ